MPIITCIVYPIIIGVLAGSLYYFWEETKHLREEVKLLKDNIEIMNEQLYAKYEEVSDD